MKCDNHDGNDSNHSNKCLNSKGSAAPPLPLPTQIHRSKHVICITDIIGNTTLPNRNLINSQRTVAEPAILRQTLSSQKHNVVKWAFIPGNPLHGIKIPNDHKHEWKRDKIQIQYLLIQPLLEEKQILNTAQST
jgi:hypothetical protein